jgi:hypothetical protein
VLGGALVVVLEVVVLVEVVVDDELVVVLSGVVVVDVVEVVVAPPLRRSPTEVFAWVSLLPETIELSGLPTASSMTLTTPRERAKVTPMAARGGQRDLRVFGGTRRGGGADAAGRTIERPSRVGDVS